MMKHLTPEEFVDALEGALTPARAAHLDACASCRADVDAAGALVSEARRGAASEGAGPSPLFWPHFEARVRAATDAQPMSGGAWWTPRWQFGVAAASVLALAVAGTWMTRLPDPMLPAAPNQIAAMPNAPGPRPVPDDSRTRMIAADPLPAEGRGAGTRLDAEWGRVVTLTGALADDDRLTVVPATTGSAGLIEDLSPSQLREFLRLLRAEQGGTP